MSQRSLQNSPLESSCVVAIIKNYNTSKFLKVSPEMSQILSCDSVVANERNVLNFSIRLRVTIIIIIIIIYLFIYLLACLREINFTVTEGAN